MNPRQSTTTQSTCKYNMEKKRETLFHDMPIENKEKYSILETDPLDDGKS